jgi:hypothetical protein
MPYRLPVFLLVSSFGMLPQGSPVSILRAVKIDQGMQVPPPKNIDTAPRTGGSRVPRVEQQSDDCIRYLIGISGRNWPTSGSKADSALQKACSKTTDTTHVSYLNRSRSTHVQFPPSNDRWGAGRDRENFHLTDMRDSLRAWGTVPRRFSQQTLVLALLLCACVAVWMALLTIRWRVSARTRSTPAFPVENCAGTEEVHDSSRSHTHASGSLMPWFDDPTDWLERDETSRKLSDGTVVYERRVSAGTSSIDALWLLPIFFLGWPVVGWFFSRAVVSMAHDIVNTRILGTGSWTLTLLGIVVFFLAISFLARVVANWRGVLMYFGLLVVPWLEFSRVLMKLMGHTPSRRMHVSLKAVSLIFLAVVSSHLAFPAAIGAAKLFRDVHSEAPALLTLLEWTALSLLLSSVSILLASILSIWRLGRHMLRELFWTGGALQLTPLDASTPDHRHPTIKVIHLSDLHLTADEATPMLDGGKSPNPVLTPLVAGHRKCLESADVILVTGDMTNAGAAPEWRVFFDHFDPDLLRRMILLPGNHDINITHPRNIYATEGPSRIHYKLRMIRMLTAMNMVQGDRAWVYIAGSRRTLQEHLSPYAEQFKSLSEQPPRPVEQYSQAAHEWVDATPSPIQYLLNLPERTWDEVFPMVVLEPEARFAVLILDSNETNQNIVENAFGHISSAQLSRIPQALAHIGRLPILCAFHHHIALPGRSVKTLTQIRPFDAIAPNFLVLDNALDVLRALPEEGKFLLFHGHRHFGYHGKFGPRLTVISAPSTTLGNEGVPPRHRSPGFFEYTVSLDIGSAAISRATFHEGSRA